MPLSIAFDVMSQLFAFELGTLNIGIRKPESDSQPLLYTVYFWFCYNQSQFLHLNVFYKAVQYFYENR